MRRKYVLLLILVFSHGLVACTTVKGRYSEYTTTPEARRAFHAEIFDSAWSQVEAKYFDSTFNGHDWNALGDRYREAAIDSPDRDALYRVLNTMFAELGVSHLEAIPPERMRQVQSGAYQGFGYRFALLDGQVVVREVFPGSPAGQAGVQPGWLLVALDGIPVPQAFSEPGMVPGQSNLHEFVDAQDQSRQVRLTSGLVDQQQRTSRRIDGDIAHIRFDAFSIPDIRWLRAELKQLQSVPAVILDLRRNGGGNEMALKRAIREFFPSEVLSGQIVSSGGKKKDLVADVFFASEYPGEVYILTSRSTSSAAEIFAHVLKSHGRATLIGDRTAGRVLRSKYFRLPDAGFLQIPLQAYQGIAGERLEGTGIRPDVPVPAPGLAELRRGDDPVLEKAVALAREKLATAPLSLRTGYSGDQALAAAI